MSPGAASDLVINIIGGAALLLLGYSVQRVRARVRLATLRNLWRPFLTQTEVPIVVSSRPGPYTRSTPRVSFTEMLGYTAISRLLAGFGVRTRPVSGEQPLATVSNGHLVVLGSPFANKVSRHLWESVGASVPFSFIDESQSIVVGNRRYDPLEGEHGYLRVDFGMLVRVPNPLDRNYTLLLCMGCHGYATLGTVEMVTSRVRARQLADAVGTDDFAAVIRFELRDNAVAEAGIEECYVLRGR